MLGGVGNPNSYFSKRKLNDSTKYKTPILPQFHSESRQEQRKNNRTNAKAEKTENSFLFWLTAEAFWFKIRLLKLLFREIR
jgi:hypothetical protein